MYNPHSKLIAITKNFFFERNSYHSHAHIENNSYAMSYWYYLRLKYNTSSPAPKILWKHNLVHTQIKEPT